MSNEELVNSARIVRLEIHEDGKVSVANPRRSRELNELAIINQWQTAQVEGKRSTENIKGTATESHPEHATATVHETGPKHAMNSLVELKKYRSFSPEAASCSGCQSPRQRPPKRPFSSHPQSPTSIVSPTPSHSKQPNGTNVRMVEIRRSTSLPMLLTNTQQTNNVSSGNGSSPTSSSNKFGSAIADNNLIVLVINNRTSSESKKRRKIELQSDTEERGSSMNELLGVSSAPRSKSSAANSAKPSKSSRMSAGSSAPRPKTSAASYQSDTEDCCCARQSDTEDCHCGSSMDDLKGATPRSKSSAAKSASRSKSSAGKSAPRSKTSAGKSAPPSKTSAANYQSDTEDCRCGSSMDDLLGVSSAPRSKSSAVGTRCRCEDIAVQVNFEPTPYSSRTTVHKRSHMCVCQEHRHHSKCIYHCIHCPGHSSSRVKPTIRNDSRDHTTQTSLLDIRPSSNGSYATAVDLVSITPLSTTVDRSLSHGSNFKQSNSYASNFVEQPTVIYVEARRPSFENSIQSTNSTSQPLSNMSAHHSIGQPMQSIHSTSQPFDNMAAHHSIGQHMPSNHTTSQPFVAQEAIVVPASAPAAASSTKATVPSHYCYCTQQNYCYYAPTPTPTHIGRTLAGSQQQRLPAGGSNFFTAIDPMPSQINHDHPQCQCRTIPTGMSNPNPRPEVDPRQPQSAPTTMQTPNCPIHNGSYYCTCRRDGMH